MIQFGVGVGTERTPALSRTPISPGTTTPGPTVWCWLRQTRANVLMVFGKETLPLKAARTSCRFQGNSISCFTGKSTLKRSIENWHFHPSQTHSLGIFGFVFTGLDDNKQACILLPQETTSDSTSVSSFPHDKAPQSFFKLKST